MAHQLVSDYLLIGHKQNEPSKRNNNLKYSQVIPSVIINIFGILLVGSQLYPIDAPYLVLLFALFIPAGAVLFLTKKLHLVSLK
jgi:hypothetical protein